MTEINIDFASLGPEEVAVLLLVLASNRAMEKNLRHEIEKTGMYKCVVTEIGTGIDTARRKVVSAVVGASLDNGLINKTPNHVHALLHAAEEAIKVFMESNPLASDLGVRISIVRDSQWIVVAMLGSASAHYLSNHKSISLGMMHMVF